MQTANIPVANAIARQCEQQSLPFVFYRLPGTAQVILIVQTKGPQKEGILLKEVQDQSGFIFHPFEVSPSHPLQFIRGDIQVYENALEEVPALLGDTTLVSDPGQAPAHLPYQLSPEAYAENVRQAVQTIQESSLQKVIQFRVQLQAVDASFNALEYFAALSSTYTDAFTYMLYTPETGTWIGASPEKLLTIHHRSLETVALAATQSIDGRQLSEIKWSDKEKSEQEVVATFIESALSLTIGENFSTHGPETIAAGKIAHLSTGFRAPDVDLSRWTSLAANLHPTPAVGGLPRNLALQYIKDNEQVDRSYYAGYLGPVNVNDSIDLFVNIRCMQVFRSALALYLGCGITEDSDPEKEFRESQYKSLTLLNVLRKNYDL